MGLAYGQLGHTQDALACFERALELFRTLGDRRVESDLLGNIADATVRSGHLEDAIPYYQEALTIAQDVSDKGGVSEQWLGLAYVSHHLGHPAEARRSYHEGLALEFLWTNYRCAILLGILCLEESQVLEAQHYYTRGIDLCHALLDKTPHLVRPLYSLALAYLGNRQPDDALDTYRRAFEVCSATGVVRGALQDVQLLKRVSPPVVKLDDVTQLLQEAMGKIAE
jgi:tetratricopeptide (TPR) repeat protein